MKIFFLFALAAFAFAACEQAPIEEQSSASKLGYDVPDTIYASLDDDATRTYVEQGKYLRWHAGDEISFFPVTYNMQYQFQGETGDNNGAFKKLTTDLVAGNELNNNYAVYPYKKSTAMSDEGIISFELPAEQGYAEDSFGLGANTMVAITSGKEDNILRFKNACGYLKLNLYGEDVCVKSIMLKGNNDEKIAGASTITAIYGNDPVVVMNEEATTTITLDCGDGVTLGTTEETATAFWFVIPATTFEEGFTVTVTDTEGGVFAKSTSSSLTIERNHIQPMKALEVECVKPMPKPANNEILYTNGSTTEATTPYQTDVFGANIVSNTYDTEKECWVIKFDGDVTGIGQYAFHDCSSLTSVTIPDSVTTIGWEAFSGCGSLTSVTIPDNVKEIGNSAFYWCTSLASVTIGNRVRWIEDNAFSNCSSLTSVTIPDSVTSIGDYAFRSCTSLTSVTIPDSVEEIGNRAFDGCSSLIEFSGKYASEDGRCLIIDGTLISFAPAGLTEYTIPESVTTIGSSAFSGCSSLISITIPDSVTTIGYSAFYGCSSIECITIPNSVTSIGGSAFSGCIGELTVNCNIPDADYDSGSGFSGSQFTSVTIGDGVTTIGNYAFYGCKSLTNITIPNSLIKIGNYTFRNCTSLTSVTIPDSVTSIGSFAFYGCSSLTNITIPDSVTSIGNYAFYDCKSLTNITIPNSLIKIGNYTFYNCSSLTSITIHDSVTSIGSSAFYGCSSLTSVSIGDSVTTFGEEAFRGCTGELTVNCNIPSYSYGVFYKSNFTKVTIGDAVTSIGKYAFRYCDSITSVTIGKGVVSIGEEAFSECTGELIVNCNIPSTTNGAFYNANFTSATIGDGVTTIGNNAFRYCENLTDVTIPNSVTKIGEYAFSWCDNLANVNIPYGVTMIGQGAFGVCYSLTSITIPKSVTSIGMGAFSSCRSLTSVYCECTTPPTGGSYMFDSNASDRKIYVPTESVDAYKSAEYWSEYASVIEGYDF